MDAHRTILKSLNKNNALTVKNLSNFLPLNAENFTAKMNSYVESLKKSSSSQISNNSLKKIKELLKTLIKSANSELLLQRLFQTISLHKMNCQKKATSIIDSNGATNNASTAQTNSVDCYEDLAGL